MGLGRVGGLRSGRRVQVGQAGSGRAGGLRSGRRAQVG